MAGFLTGLSRGHFECKSVETSEKEDEMDKMEKQFALEIIYCDD